jgi:hypothetical protein
MSVTPYSRIIDFGNGPNADNIVLGLSHGNTLKPYLKYRSRAQVVFTSIFNIQITLNQWQFLTVTFNGTNIRVYLNGTFFGESNTQSYTRPFNLSRSKCYIGKSNWPENGYTHSYLDDLRFYNKSLTQKEISEIMNSFRNETSMLSYLQSFRDTWTKC